MIKVKIVENIIFFKNYCAVVTLNRIFFFTNAYICLEMNCSKINKFKQRLQYTYIYYIVSNYSVDIRNVFIDYSQFYRTRYNIFEGTYTLLWSEIYRLK